jgi:gamma-glutamyltranspeptidase/glutathione hydrolase
VKTILIFLTMFLVPAVALHAEANSSHDGHRVQCKNGAVVTASGPASDAGVEILKQGGNAIDAAVATAFAMAVTFPSAGNVGGGGYMLFMPAGGAEPVVFDFREVAPAAATVDMFVDPAKRTPHRLVGVPGTVRGLAMAHAKHGKLPWKDLVAPGMKLAKEGFDLDRFSAKSINSLLKSSDKKTFAELHRVFTKPGGEPWKEGDRLVQPDLYETLSRIASNGPDGFYAGKTAKLLADEMREHGGIITESDLAAYQAIERKPVRGTYRGYEIISNPPSASGGTTLIEMLNILETFDLSSRDRFSPATLHLMIEAMKRAYCDRARYLGDPAFNTIPDMLRSKERGRELAAGIDPQHATESTSLAPELKIVDEGEHTTHFSVVDKFRNAIAMTYTLESSYGSRVVVTGGGFILNDEMRDFNWLPGVTDKTGRIGTPPNLIAPGKRMISSQTPTIVAQAGKPVLVTGSPGGRTIINTVLNVVINVIDYRMDVTAAVDAPRIHHQWLPDRVRFEKSLVAEHPEVPAQLESLGHQIDKPAQQGDAHSIWIDWQSGGLIGAADSRVSGKASGY